MSQSAGRSETWTLGKVTSHTGLSNHGADHHLILEFLSVIKMRHKFHTQFLANEHMNINESADVHVHVL